MAAIRRLGRASNAPTHASIKVMQTAPRAVLLTSYEIRDLTMIGDGDIGKGIKRVLRRYMQMHKVTDSLVEMFHLAWDDSYGPQ